MTPMEHNFLYARLVLHIFVRTDTQNSELSETVPIIIVVAADVPLLTHQLKRLAQTISLGIDKKWWY